MPLACVMHVDFHTTLIIQTALPLSVVGILYITSHMLHWIEKRQAKQRTELRRSASRKSGTGERISKAEATALLKPLTERLRSTCMNGIFLILFLVYPGAVAKSFAAFQCIPLHEVNLRLLRSDFGIDCDSGRHQLMQWGYALPAVFLYPLGVPLLLISVLWHHRVRLRYWRDREAAAEASEVIMALGLPDPRREGDRLSVADVREAAKTDTELPPYLLRLTAGYECKYAWFEVFEMARKLALIGLAVFFESGSLSQVAYGLIICFTSFGMFMLWSPYQDQGEDRLAQLAQVQIFVALVASVILRADPSKQSTANLDIILTVMLFCPILLALFLVTPLPAIAKRRWHCLARCLGLAKQQPQQPHQPVSKRISKIKASPRRVSIDRRSHLDDVIDDLIDGFGVQPTSTAKGTLARGGSASRGGVTARGGVTVRSGTCEAPPSSLAARKAARAEARATRAAERAAWKAETAKPPLLAPQRLPPPGQSGGVATSMPPAPQSVTAVSDALRRRSVCDAFYRDSLPSNTEVGAISSFDHELHSFDASDPVNREFAELREAPVQTSRVGSHPRSGRGQVIRV